MAARTRERNGVHGQSLLLCARELRHQQISANLPPKQLQATSIERPIADVASCIVFILKGRVQHGEGKASAAAAADLLSMAKLATSGM